MTVDPTALQTWQAQVALADELLADIAAGRTSRPYSAVVVEGIKEERERFIALIRSAADA